jgi:hypothetical protein
MNDPGTLDGDTVRFERGWHELLDTLRARLENVQPADPMRTMRELLPQYESRPAK